MNAQELYLKDGKPTGVYFCEKCRCVSRTRELTEQCCKNYVCKDCGKDTGGRTWLVCESCRNAERDKREQERFEKAEKFIAWNDWVFDGEEFFDSVGEFIAQRLYDGDDLPEYVWACKSERFVHADISDITDRTEEPFEDFDPKTLNGLRELKSAIAAFNEANKDAVAYSPDYTKAVLIPLGAAGERE